MLRPSFFIAVYRVAGHTFSLVAGVRIRKVRQNRRVTGDSIGPCEAGV